MTMTAQDIHDKLLDAIGKAFDDGPEAVKTTTENYERFINAHQKVQPKE